MIILKPEIRIPLVGLFLIGIVASLLLIDKLGALTSICFSLACLILFVVFVIMPHNLEQEYTKLKSQNSPLWLYKDTYLDYKKKADVQYAEQVRNWLGIAVFLFVLGIVLYLISH